MNKIYILYSDDTKSELLSTASSKEDRDLITQEYTTGQWYQYDYQSGSQTCFLAETEKKIKVKFPETAILISDKIERSDDDHGWIKGKLTY